MGFLSDLTTKYSLESRHGQAWGFIDGYWFQLEPPSYGKDRLLIRTAVHLPDEQASAAIKDALSELIRTIPVTASAEGGSVKLEWRQTMKGFKADAVDSLLVRLVALFRKAGAAPACFQCNSERTDGFALVNGTAVRLCSQCQAEIESTIAKDAEAYAAANNNYLRGILGALAGALIGSVAWVVIGLLGYIAAIGGIAISFCAVKGYQLMKGKITKPAILIICLICLLAMVLAELATVDIVVYNQYQAQVTFGEVLAKTFEIQFYDNESTMTFVKNCALGLLFMAIGGYQIIKPLFSKAAAPAGKFERL